MEEALKTAIKNVAEQAAKTTKADEALKFTQAATNAANALACLSNIKK